MKKNEKLETLYQYALDKGLCSSKKSFANLIGISESNISKVFADTNDKYCTSNVLLKANAALSNAFSHQWLMYDIGSMMANPSPINDDLIQAKKRIEELEYVLELQKHRILQLERECEQLKKASSIAMTHPATTA